MGGKEGGEREGGRWMEGGRWTEGEREKNTGERRVERGETERKRYGNSARGKELKSEKDRESHFHVLFSFSSSNELLILCLCTYATNSVSFSLIIVRRM